MIRLATMTEAEVAAAERIAIYYLDQACDSSWPSDVLLDLCKFHWPKKTFRVRDDAEDDYGLYYLNAIVDEEGVKASKLLASEFPDNKSILRVRKIEEAKDAERSAP